MTSDTNHTNNGGRRNFLKMASTGAISAAALAASPPSIRRALAIPVNNATGTMRDVEHVVILMQKNHSFDNYFGTLQGVRGFGDRFPIPLAGGLNIWQQTYVPSSGPSRTVLPYYLNSSAGNVQRVPGTLHNYPGAQNAWDLGRMSKWPTYKQTRSADYYKRAELDFQFALANAFTLCDAYHCSFHGGTSTNRLFHWTGTNDLTGVAGGPVIDNDSDHLDAGVTYSWKTYPGRLQATGVSQKVYQNMPDNLTDNPLTGFKTYRDANAAHGNLADGTSFPPYTPTGETVSPLIKGVGSTMPDGSLLQALKDDVAAGQLPQMSWVVAPATYPRYPGPSNPIQDAWYTQKVLNAFTANPAVQSKTVLFINFDENDGFFDHTSLLTAPAYDNGMLAGKSTIGTTSEYHTDKNPYGPGPRVSMYVVSPQNRGGWVNSQTFDHTSVLRPLELHSNVKEADISAYRRAVLGDLTSAFSSVDPNTETLPTLPSRDKATTDSIRTTQGLKPQVPLLAVSAQQMPKQAADTHPLRALPYELHVSAREDTTNHALRLIFSSTDTTTSVFHVYDHLHPDRVPHYYAVKPDKMIDDTWDMLTTDKGKYGLWVLGPNGFHRAFSSDVSAVSAAGSSTPEIRVYYDVTNAEIYVAMMNTSTVGCTFTVKPDTYCSDGPWTYDIPVGKQLDRHWPIARQGSWYDFTVMASQGGFARRFAGRMETGKGSVSDPTMGI